MRAPVLSLLVVALVTAACGAKNDETESDLKATSGRCKADLSVTYFDQVSTYSVCLDVRQATSGDPAGDCTAGKVFASTGTWSTAACDLTGATAKCDYDKGAGKGATFYYYNASFNNLLSESCSDDSVFTEITPKTETTASLGYTYGAYRTCEQMTAMSPEYRAAAKKYYAEKTGELGTWAWTDDGTCDQTNVKATCKATGDLLDSITNYYDDVPDQSTQDDCKNGGGTYVPV